MKIHQALHNFKINIDKGLNISIICIVDLNYLKDFEMLYQTRRSEYDQSQVVTDARRLSSGTIATLTGLRSYTDIDRVRNKFLMFIQSAQASDPNCYSNYKDAWKCFVKSYDIKSDGSILIKQGCFTQND